MHELKQIRASAASRQLQITDSYQVDAGRSGIGEVFFDQRKSGRLCGTEKTPVRFFIEGVNPAKFDGLQDLRGRRLFDQVLLGIAPVVLQDRDHGCLLAGHDTGITVTGNDHPLPRHVSDQRVARPPPPLNFTPPFVLSPLRQRPAMSNQ